MKDVTVAVVKNDFHEKHSTSWSHEWLCYCEENNIRHSLIDWRALDAFELLAQHDIVLWHFSNYSADEMMFARPMLAALKTHGCSVFPDSGDAAHFDDKVAQAYLLQALGLPVPANYPLHSIGAVESWAATVGKYPVVAKLKTGSGSSNVTLIQSADQLRRYAGRMFGRGVRSRPNALFKIRSNVVSAKSVTEILKRARRGPEFVFSWLNASRLPREKGYVYLQEFVPRLSEDLKIVVVGNKLSYICRAVRSGDFRASGGGDIFYDRKMITPELAESAFHAAAELNSDCTGFDMIIDPRTQRPLILEVSYGFSHKALLAAGEHCDRSGIWYPEPLNAPRALLERLILRIKNG